MLRSSVKVLGLSLPRLERRILWAAAAARVSETVELEHVVDICVVEEATVDDPVVRDFSTSSPSLEPEE